MQQQHLLAANGDLYSLSRHGITHCLAVTLAVSDTDAHVSCSVGRTTFLCS